MASKGGVAAIILDDVFKEQETSEIDEIDRQKEG